MIIGKGLISKSLTDSFVDNKDILIFASGVSNSTETNEEVFRTERNLLDSTIKKNPDKKIVYFSSIFVKNKLKVPYYIHKKNMEKLIKKKSKNYLIIRLPQVIGLGGNQNNLINFLVKKIDKSETIYIEKKTYRAIIDIDDLKKIVIYLLKTKKKIVNIYGFERVEVIEIVDTISKIKQKPIFVVLMEKGISIKKNKSRFIKKMIKNTQINIKNYTIKTLKKYLND